MRAATPRSYSFGQGNTLRGTEHEPVSPESNFSVKKGKRFIGTDSVGVILPKESSRTEAERVSQQQHGDYHNNTGVETPKARPNTRNPTNNPQETRTDKKFQGARFRLFPSKNTCMCLDEGKNTTRQKTEIAGWSRQRQRFGKNNTTEWVKRIYNAKKRKTSASTPANPPEELDEQPMDHIVWKGEEVEELGYDCFFCGNDLAFDTKTTVCSDTVPASTALFSCGHIFHTNCLMILSDLDKHAHEEEKNGSFCPCCVQAYIP